MEVKKMAKKKPSKFMELISMSVPNFFDFNYDVEDFCGFYINEGKVCPFILADQDDNRQFKYIANFDAQNCMWMCKWFIKPDLPRDCKRTKKVIK